MIIVWPAGANQQAEYYGMEAYAQAYSSATQAIRGPAAWTVGEVYLPGFQQGEAIASTGRWSEGEVYLPGFQQGQKAQIG